MKLQLEKEEEREKVPMKKKEQLEEEIRKHVKERMNEVEDPPPPGPGGIGGELFDGMDAPRDPYGWGPPGRPEPDPMLRIRWSCGCFEDDWIKSQSQACLRLPMRKRTVRNGTRWLAW